MSDTDKMTTASQMGDTQMGGKKKSNGHKATCMCPICKNMMKKMKSKRGGGEDEEFVMEESVVDEPKMEGGKKKSNGHKANCKCPICKNMMKNKKSKRGGEGESYEEDIEIGVMNEEKNDMKADEENNMEAYDFDNEEEIKEKEYKKMDAAEKGELGLESVGGMLRRKGRKSRKGGKSRKTRKTRKNRKSRRKNRK